MRGLPELILCVIGVIGNVGTIAIVFGTRRFRRSPQHLLISALSMNDTFYLVAVASLLVIIDSTADDASVNCDFTSLVALSTASMSVMLLLIIALNRYGLVVRRAQQKAPLSTRTLLALIASAIVFSYGVYGVASLFLGDVELSPSGLSCTPAWHHAGSKPGVAILTVLSVFFVSGSLVLIAFVYHRMWSVFKRSTAGSAYQSLERRVTLHCAIIVAVFVLCYTPIIIMLVATVLTGEPSDALFDRISITAVTFNAAFNPVLYVWLGTYRRSWHLLLTCRWRELVGASDITTKGRDNGHTYTVDNSAQASQMSVTQITKIDITRAGGPMPSMPIRPRPPP